ncbi:MAG TPA: N-acetylmuramoyl-L-alanine amidase [Actinomycetota bacterium]|nr:N-acetylmuramoyl-L-alanine amidase [Actinomycetota bacterium]
MSRLIKVGDRSDEVADIQARLRRMGFDVADDPGVFGVSTRQAVQSFQQRRQILVDGIVGTNTWSELVEASWRLGDRTLYLRQPPTRGDDVSTLQRRLSALGFDPGREDGIFGINTATAVRSFQKEYGVSEDGIWGPVSQDALAGLRVDRPGTAARLREELKRQANATIRDALIVIDPGHGADDPGGLGGRGNRESDLCWDLAVRLAGHLSDRGARVRFTRNEAESPEASERARRANRLAGDLFVSLHLNAHEEPTAEGASTFYFGNSAAGEALAEHIQGELIGLGIRDCRAHARSYTVLRETRMPAVIVEPVFITNPDEEKRVEEPELRDAIAGAIARAIDVYYRYTAN